MHAHHSRQSSQYDKILKENLEASIPALIEKVLHIQVFSSDEIPDDVQHTKERKPDALKRITDQAGNTFILHLEFQLADDPKMVHRMHSYCAMLLERYELPLRQYVLYLGQLTPRMATFLVISDLSFRYNLVHFQQLDYRLFLSSAIPEEILLAVLGNFSPSDSWEVLTNVLIRLDQTATSSLDFERYITQLRVLVQLRKLRPLFETAMDNLAHYINEQGDPFYVKGERKGLEKGLQKGLQKGQRVLVRNLLLETNFSIERIASLTETTVAFVEAVKRGLSAQ